MLGKFSKFRAIMFFLEIWWCADVGSLYEIGLYFIFNCIVIDLISSEQRCFSSIKDLNMMGLFIKLPYL